MYVSLLLGFKSLFLVYMVLGFESLFFVNKYSCIFIRKPLSPALCVLLTTCNHDPEAYIPHREMAGLSVFSHIRSGVYVVQFHILI